MWQDWTSREEEMDLLLWEVIPAATPHLLLFTEFIVRCREQARFTFKVDLGRFKNKKNKKRRKQNQGKKTQQS